eukprot:gene3266-3747_t
MHLYSKGLGVVNAVFMCLTWHVIATLSAENIQQQQQRNAVELLISRLLPGREGEFVVVIDEDGSVSGSEKYRPDVFQLQTVRDNKLQITATTGVTAAWGFNHFLKYYCNAHVSWSGRQLNVSRPLPKLTETLKITSSNRYRYYQNVCTSSYSFVWWNWTRWEKEIDWMALNGINLPLAFTGQEEIWRRVYLKFGLSQDQLDGHFAGPAFLAWGRMGNLKGWGGPLPKRTWYEMQLALQHKILTRMRSFGMIPVLPGFAGHVPSALQSLYPHSNIRKLEDWGGFNSTYCCTSFLDPNDALFQNIGKAFIEEQMKEYNGTDHIYNGDSFNEMAPLYSDPAYLSNTSRSTLSAMQLADPQAIWLMQGWLFRNRGFWTADNIKAYVTGVPIGKMIILDLFAEADPIWKETESFYGQPFIWCMLHNYGGNLGLYGKVQSITTGPIEARKAKGSSMQGTGMTPEGIEQNDFIYDLMAEMGWRDSELDVKKWTMAYSDRRYGLINEDARKAWQLLVKSIYNCTDNHANHNHDVPVSRPSFKVQKKFWYKLADIIGAWQKLLSAADLIGQSETFRYDLVDVGRQVLEDLSYSIYLQLKNAYENKNKEDVKEKGNKLIGLLEDLDKLMSSDKHYLLGAWLENAKRMGQTPGEKLLYEFNARNQITLWGPDGNINDYGNKMWGGLIKSYYAERWKLFVAEATNAVAAGKEIDMRAFDKKLLAFERNWNQQTNIYPTRATGYSVSISVELYAKYFKDMLEFAAKFKPELSNETIDKISSNSGYSHKEHL